MTDEGRRRPGEDDRLEMLETIVSHLDDAVVVSDAEGVIRFVNPAWERMFGYAADEAVGSTGKVLIRSGEHSRRFWEEIHGSLREGRTWRGRIVSRHRDGPLVPQAVTLVPVSDDDGRVGGVVSVRRDVSDTERSERALRDASLRDALTGLPNRLLLADRIRQAAVRARRRTGRFAILFVDLDDFREVNRRVQHAGGDQVLRGVAARLEAVLRPEDTLARVGGDEFVALVEGIEGPEAALELAQRLSATLHEPFVVGEHALSVSASVGVTMGSHEVSPEELLSTADAAMFVAKAEGKDRAVDRPAPRSSEGPDQLDEALRTGAIEPWFQPIVQLADGRPVAAEVLARWPQGPSELASAKRFLRIAQQTGRLRELGLQMLERALAEAASLGSLPLHVNFTGRELTRSDLLERLPALLAARGVAPGRLVIELAEDTVMRDPAVALEACIRLQELGIGLAVDDFGTGFSGLDHLQRLPARFLKIDRRFVAQLPGSAEATRVARSVVALCEVLDFVPIAEGVETEEQRAALVDLGCAIGQGWLFAPALPASEFRLRYGC